MNFIKLKVLLIQNNKLSLKINLTFFKQQLIQITLEMQIVGLLKDIKLFNLRQQLIVR